MTSTVHSTDGTAIAYEKTGAGPALILVDGALCHRESGPSRKLAALLAERYTVYTYDRRGRGESGDTGPYSAEREVDDIAALIEEAGGSASLYGISSGAVLAADAANRLPGIQKLAVYEAPFAVDPEANVVPGDFVPRLEQMVAEGRRGDAVQHFMKQVGAPAFFRAAMRLLPVWKELKAVAHTLPYDFAILGDTGSGNPLPADRWSSVSAPALVMSGGKSDAWMGRGAKAFAAALPDAEYRELPGQNHMLEAEALAPVLIEFLGQPSSQAPEVALA